MSVTKTTYAQSSAIKNPISHVGIGEEWARQNGEIVYPDGGKITD